MRYRVVILPRAKLRIRQAVDFYLERSRSVDVASRWLNGLSRELALLAESPERFPLARESGAFDFPIRELLYGSGREKTHRVLFRIVESTVEVLTVRHRAQNDVAPDEL